MVLSENETAQLRTALQDAVVKCSERCLYQSAKWCVTKHLLTFPSNRREAKSSTSQGRPNYSMRYQRPRKMQRGQSLVRYLGASYRPSSQPTRTRPRRLSKPVKSANTYWPSPSSIVASTTDAPPSSCPTPSSPMSSRRRRPRRPARRSSKPTKAWPWVAAM